MVPRIHRWTGKGLLAGIIGTLSCITPSTSWAQQTSAGPVRGFFRGLREGVCIDFLVSPADAAQQIGHLGAPQPVESLATAYPALAREAASEPAYQGWIPAQYCWYLYTTVGVNGREMQNDDGRQPAAIGYLAIATGGLPEGATAVAAEFFTNVAYFAGVAGDARLRVDKVRITRSPIPDQEEVPDRFRFEIRDGGAVIQWDGGPGTPTTPSPVTVSLAGLGITTRMHFARATITPDSAFTPSGNLRVFGKGDLKRMLAASPIRLITTLLRGGDTEWDLVQ